MIEDISGQYSSIAGYVGSQLDDIPKIGDSMRFEGYICEIVDMDGIKIDKLLFTQIESSQDVVSAEGVEGEKG